MNLKIKYAILGAMIVPVFGRLALSGTDHAADLYRYLVPLLVGCFAGYLLGREKLRWLKKNSELDKTARKLQSQIEFTEKLDKTFLKKEDNLKKLLDNITGPLYLKDKDGRYLIVNRQYEKLAHLDREEIIGKNDFEIFPAVIAELFRSQDNEVKKKNAPLEFEETIPLPDAELTFITSKFPLHDHDGTISAVGGFCTDITRRKHVEKKLEAEQKRLAVTLRSIGDGVITTDTDGRVVLVNIVAEKLTGWSQEEAVGRPVEEIFHIINERTGSVCENPITKVIALGKIIGLSNHTVLVAKDGTRRDLADSGAPIYNDANEMIGGVLVFRDVSSQRMMEEDLLKAKKLESVGVLAGGIAHDFNNFLMAIMGNIELAKMTMGSNHESAKLLNTAHKAGKRAQMLTQQLLTFSKGGAPVRKTAHLNEIIKDSALFVLSGSNVTCSFDFPENLWPAHFDEGQISQVIQNLTLNADRAMPHGGKITISCRNYICKKDNTLPVAPGKYVEVIFQDTGTGIPHKYLSKIFDPYFSTAPAGGNQGSGLGLSIVYSIISKHDGTIQVTSQKERGATFTFYLPASPAHDVDQKTSRPAMHTGKGKILIMDDENMIAELAEKMLAMLGYETAVASDGQQAITQYVQAQKEGTPYDAVILDLTVPGGMGGKEAASQLLAVAPEAKIIASSGYTNDPVMSDYKLYGFVGVIAKPYQLREISDTLQSLMIS